MIIVVTELHVKSFWHFFEFTINAVRSGKQAERAVGNKHTSVSNKGWRIGYTLTAWESKEAMHDFRNTGAHKKAMTKIRKLASKYKTLVMEGDTIPNWKEAKAKLEGMEFKVLK